MEGAIDHGALKIGPLAVHLEPAGNLLDLPGFVALRLLPWQLEACIDAEVGGNAMIRLGNLSVRRPLRVGYP